MKQTVKKANKRGVSSEKYPNHVSFILLVVGYSFSYRRTKRVK